jgi:hypothetical protein
MKTKRNLRILILAMVAMMVVAGTTAFHGKQRKVSQPYQVLLIDDPTLPSSIEDLQTLLADQPDHIAARQKLAWQLYQAGQKEQAILQSRESAKRISDPATDSNGAAFLGRD